MPPSLSTKKRIEQAEQEYTEWWREQMKKRAEKYIYLRFPDTGEIVAIPKTDQLAQGIPQQVLM